MAKPLSFNKKMAVLQKTMGNCAYCGAGLVNEGVFTIDHVTPRALGGSNEIGNLLAACMSCNGSKGKKTLEQFRTFSAVKAATGETIFGQAQAEYLLRIGAFDAIGADENHEFFFEQMGGA
ncbi:HNH endonuclease [Ectopseudomonas mendocina]|uniref:HNH endonuclease n=1 Tax=Ectopseudomonas mendocina TaxID=300 RepID=A0ABZ2RA97_ECTME